MSRFRGAGLYDKYDGSLIILGSLSALKVGKGEVYEGSREDYNSTFGIDDEITLTKRELARLIDQSDCEEEGVLANYIEKDEESIEYWLEDRWEDLGGECNY